MVKTTYRRPATRPVYSSPPRSMQLSLEETVEKAVKQLVACGYCIGSRRWELADDMVKLIQRYQK